MITVKIASKNMQRFKISTNLKFSTKIRLCQNSVPRDKIQVFSEGYVGFRCFWCQMIEKNMLDLAMQMKIKFENKISKFSSKIWSNQNFSTFSRNFFTKNYFSEMTFYTLIIYALGVLAM